MDLGKSRHERLMKERDNLVRESRESVLIRSRKDSHKNVSLEDFELQLQLGRGTFGKVYLAELKKTKVLYAIKVIRKDVLIEYD